MNKYEGFLISESEDLTFEGLKKKLKLLKEEKEKEGEEVVSELVAFVVQRVDEMVTDKMVESDYINGNYENTNVEALKNGIKHRLKSVLTEIVYPGIVVEGDVKNLLGNHQAKREFEAVFPEEIIKGVTVKREEASYKVGIYFHTQKESIEMRIDKNDLPPYRKWFGRIIYAIKTCISEDNLDGLSISESGELFIETYENEAAALVKAIINKVQNRGEVVELFNT